jgi:hypothetical protein
MAVLHEIKEVLLTNVEGSNDRLRNVTNSSKPHYSRMVASGSVFATHGVYRDLEKARSTIKVVMGSSNSTSR